MGHARHKAADLGVELTQVHHGVGVRSPEPWGFGSECDRGTRQQGEVNTPSPGQENRKGRSDEAKDGRDILPQVLRALHSASKN